MKKLFMLLAMVGLAAASCTPNGEGPGNNGGGSDEFTIEVSNITEYGATIKVTPKDMERTYFHGVWDYATFVGLGGATGLMEAAYELYKERVEAGKESWLSGPYPLLKSGVSERTLEALSPGTKYVAMVFGVDANGNLTSTTPTHTEFITKDSTFDTSVWEGVWNVTTDYVFVEKVANGQYVSGVQSAEGFSRPVEIIDAELVFGSEYAGYAAILGWDALFPELQADGLDYTLPILGTYIGNTIELSNEFIIGTGNYSDTGDPYYIKWYAQWLTELENLYVVNGDYPPYTFKMGNDGNVTIEAYSGSLDGGEDGTVARLSVWLEDSEGFAPYYVYTSLAEAEEALLHFSGETMTAAKVDAGATPAPAKLSAKKGANNFRAVHKMAHPTTSAIEFSSAVKAAKFGEMVK